MALPATGLTWMLFIMAGEPVLPWKSRLAMCRH